MLNTDWFLLLKDGELEQIEAYFDSRIFLGLMITLLLMVFQNLLTLFPLVLIVTINIFLYGFFYGFMWSWLTSLVGGLIAFVLFRYWLQTWLISRINPQLKDRIERNGMYYVFYMRLIPIVPTSLINITSGGSSIRLSHYFLATGAGNLIHIFLIGLIVNGIMSADIQNYGIPLVVGLMLVLFYFIRKGKSKRMREDNEKPASYP